MSDYTAREIEAVIEATDIGWWELRDGDMSLTLRGESVNVEAIAEHGGEGQGDDIWFVVKIGDQLFRKSGYYASHYGTDWDGDFEEVRAAEETITVYVAA